MSTTTSQKYKIFIQVILIVICNLFAYGLFIFIFGTAPQLINIPVSKIYLYAILALAYLTIIPIIIIFARKYNLNLKNEIFRVSYRDFGVVILILCIQFMYMEPMFHNPKEFINGIFSGVITTSVLSPPKFDIEFVIFCIRSMLFAPILEEVLYRGIIFNHLKKVCSVRNSIIISSLIFALMHFEFSYLFFSYFMLGIFFCISYYKTGSLLVSIIFHSFTNVVYAATKISTIEVTPIPMVFYLLSLIISVIILYYLLRFGFKNKIVDKL